MFGLFNKKSKIEILQKRYEKLMKRSHELSTVNRAESDRVFAEAQELVTAIDALTSPK
ncbi:MAG: Lacal_2735 family protein [Vicingaceae bacterium]